jgi:WS/DGAT/MGAT family acyltransferase
MSPYNFDRLSAQDNTFLLAESATNPMHVSATLLYEAGPLRTPDGGIDVDAVRRSAEGVLHQIPRYRQKLRWSPLLRDPVWVDDRQFNLDYHIRHTSLPRPGSIEQLKRMSARIMEQQLDRARPLWEIWLVEGLSGDRFAVITKIHHCMIDGMAGVDLATILLSPDPNAGVPEPTRYVPRPEPSPAELLRHEVAHRVNLPRRSLRDLRSLRSETDDLREELRARGRAVLQLLGWLRPTSETPINGDNSPHRRLDWLTTPLDDVKRVRKAAGCSVNDVVLTVVSGAMRDYLVHRNADPGRIEFRISAPVSVRRDQDQGQLGNRVSSWIIRLPIEQSDPLKRFEAINNVTQELKVSRQSLGVEMLMRLAEWTPPVLLSLGAQAASGPINTIVTNVPGPQFPLYMLGSKVVGMFPVVPLLHGMGLGIALFSYNGEMFWGFNADYDLVPDLPDFVRAVETAFIELADAVGVKVELAPQESASRP